jgi:ribose transport system substrate-binding protein
MKSAVGMAKALRDTRPRRWQSKNDRFDAGTPSVRDLENGDVQALVVQNPLLMGYLGVMTMVKHLRGEKVEKRIDTGVVLVNSREYEPNRHQRIAAPAAGQILEVTRGIYD